MIFKEDQTFYLYSLYYDLIYKDKDYINEAEYITDLVRKYTPECKDVIELGSGTGNYSTQLTGKDFYVTGIEKSRNMFELSDLKKIENFSPVIADMIDFKLGRKFDAVVALFHVISYLTETRDILSCFTNIKNHLTDSGVFVFDVWYTPAVYSIKPESRVKEVENEFYKIIRHANPVMDIEKNVVEVTYEIIISEKKSERYRMVKEIHKMRHFTTPEIESLAKQSGLKLIRSEEFLTAKAPSENTWGVCYILQKNEETYSG